MIPVKVTTRNTRHTKRIDELVAARIARLETICPRAVRCEISLDGPHGREREASARVDVFIPGVEVVGHGRGTRTLAALREAFDAARRQIQTTLEKRRS